MLELVEETPASHPLGLDLWLWRINAADETIRASRAAHLNADEAARAAAFTNDALRSRFELGRGRMREILAGYLGCAPRDVPLSTGPHGKPHLAEGAPGKGPSFNMAHSGGWAALIAAPHGVTLGIDIEAERDVDPEIAERYFSVQERAELDALPRDAWRAGFFNAWTRKEALLKALGSGLTRPLDSFDVTLTPGAPARLTRLSGALAERWQLLPIALHARFPGCIAVRHSGPVEITLREGHLPVDGAQR